MKGDMFDVLNRMAAAHRYGGYGEPPSDATMFRILADVLQTSDLNERYVVERVQAELRNSNYDHAEIRRETP